MDRKYKIKIRFKKIIKTRKTVIKLKVKEQKVYMKALLLIFQLHKNQKKMNKIRIMAINLRRKKIKKIIVLNQMKKIKRKRIIQIKKDLTKQHLVKTVIIKANNKLITNLARLTKMG